MATDGDLWARAVARGLDAESGTLLIVRPAGVSVVVGGRRVHRGACAVHGRFPPAGLYEARAAGCGFALRGVDRPGETAMVETAFRHVGAGPIRALVEPVDPAEHAAS